MRLKLKTRNNFCTGFSLLEVLIATTIGMFLIGVVLQNYLSAKKTYHVQSEMAYLSESIRFADFILRRNIMHAGFVGCRRFSELHLVNHAHNYFEEFDAIRGYDSLQLPRYLSDKKVVSGTDVIVITRANADITTVVKDVRTGATSIEVVQNPATKTNQLLLISDCKNADLFVAKNWSGHIVNSKSELNNFYQANKASVSRVERIAFFISKTEHITAKTEPIYSLYCLTNYGRKEELIPGISGLRIVYGVDTLGRGGVDQYLKAQEITERALWHKVLSVILTLEMLNQTSHLVQWKIYIKLRERGGNETGVF